MRKSSDFGLGKWFLSYDTKSASDKRVIKLRWTSLELKIFVLQRTPEWEKRSANCVSNKTLVSRINKERLQIINKKTT